MGDTNNYTAQTVMAHTMTTLLGVSLLMALAVAHITSDEWTEIEEAVEAREKFVSAAVLGFASKALTIADKIGTAVVNTITASQGTAPYVDRVSFRFNQLAREPQSSITPGMSDNDQVQVTRQLNREIDIPGCSSPNGPCEKIEFCLVNSENNWWKAITKHDVNGNKYQTEIVNTVQHGGAPHCAYVDVSEFQSYGFVLSKAKAGGVHTNMHLIQGVADLVVGGSYLFDWQRS